MDMDNYHFPQSHYVSLFSFVNQVNEALTCTETVKVVFDASESTS